MSRSLERLCEVISAENGMDVLLLLARIRYQRPRAEWGICLKHGLDETLRLLKAIELIHDEGNAIRLTPLGYIVGNVARQYCNWRDSGRKVAHMHPPFELYEGKDVLDIGCSFGRWIWEFSKHARSAVGIELQEEFVAMGFILAELEGIKPPTIVTGSAEDLDTHFEPASFDFVYSRLVLTHVHLNSTLLQIGRLLRPGSTVWFHIASHRQGWNKLLRAVKHCSFREIGFESFGLLNSFLLKVFNTQLVIRSQRRMHSEHKRVYPTVSTWRRLLTSVGFVDVTVVNPSRSETIVRGSMPRSYL